MIVEEKDEIIAIKNPYIYLDNFQHYWVQIGDLGSKIHEYAGWKFTIVGESLDDSCYLLRQLGEYLLEKGYCFKSATRAMTEYKATEEGMREQRYKCMTIYIHKSADHVELLAYLKGALSDYKCEVKLEMTPHVWGPIHKRVDRDEHGNYVAADGEVIPLK